MNLSPLRPSRLPLRFRLVSGFAAATLLALVAAGTFVYWRVEYALDRGLDSELAKAGDSLRPLVGRDGSITNRPIAGATDVDWQVLDARGRVVDHSGSTRAEPLVGPSRLRTVGAEAEPYNSGDLLPISPRPYRVRIEQLPTPAKHYLLIAVRRDHRDEALRELVVQLTVAGLGMLVFAGFVGDRFARAALQPVERYRQQASDIAAGAAELRLDVPKDRDDEVTRLGNTFNEMLAALDRALDRERAFTSEASHELRTPITLLASRIQLARRRARSAAEYEAILEELDVDVRRLAELADHLLEIGATTVPPQHESGDVTAVARRLLAGRLATSAGPMVAAELPGHAVHAAVSGVVVERMITNILTNAATHGSGPVKLAVDEPADAWVRIVVTDSGPGMPPDLLRNATRRFARSDDARSGPGAGLGLSLVEALVVQAGGQLRLCHAGLHVSHGHDAPASCAHGDDMTVTLLLPAPDGRE